MSTSPTCRVCHAKTDAYTCSIHECDRKPIARHLCAKHYSAAQRRGDIEQHTPQSLRQPKNDRCDVDECERPVAGRYCKLHSQRLRRTGRLDRLPRATDEERFWSKVEKRGPSECWPWLGSVTNAGYGQFTAGGQRYGAHRYVYELANGPIPEGLTIDHVKAWGCTRTDCVNPAHLEPVTVLENLRRSDAISAVNRRKAGCPRGHEYRTAKDGKRFCPICKADWDRRNRKSRRKVAA